MADAPVPEALVEPIRLSARVQQPAADAFRLFTEGIGGWWPLHEGFSYGGAQAKEVHLEPVVGGRFYERYTDGQEFEVGRVLVCDPPKRIVFTWQAGWSAATEVDVRFVPEGSLTRVDLEHRGWERLVASERHWRTSFNNGWPSVLARYTSAART
jgi:uncharacterized protein YndB with AHSA1/START domain